MRKAKLNRKMLTPCRDKVTGKGVVVELTREHIFLSLFQSPLRLKISYQEFINIVREKRQQRALLRRRLEKKRGTAKYREYVDRFFDLQRLGWNCSEIALMFREERRVCPKNSRYLTGRELYALRRRECARIFEESLNTPPEEGDDE